MGELVQENWILLVVALLAGVFVAWWLFVASRRTRVDLSLDRNDGPAQRNQALIDAAPAAVAVPLAPEGLAGAGEAVAAAAFSAHPEAGGDDLTRIKGVGPKLAAQLNALGVTSFAQIAAWDDAEIDRIDSQLGRFQGRIRRDSWPVQAELLARGDTAAYEAKFGKL